MKQFLNKITASALALLVLFSTLSFTIQKHYCGDFLVDISFTGVTHCCSMKMDTSNKVVKKNCCKDETHQFEGQDELQLSSGENITLNNQQFLMAFLFAYKGLFLESYPKNGLRKVFPPPEIRQNYQIIYQSFLI